MNRMIVKNESDPKRGIPWEQRGEIERLVRQYYGLPPFHLRGGCPGNVLFETYFFQKYEMTVEEAAHELGFCACALVEEVNVR